MTAVTPPLTQPAKPPTFYSLNWKDWNDNDGQKALNLEDDARIVTQSFFLAGKGAHDHDLFIARMPASMPPVASNFVDHSNTVLEAAGEYHPADNINCGRMVAAQSFMIVDKGYQVLTAHEISLDQSNYTDAYTLEWTDWDTGQEIAGEDNFLQVGVDSNGGALYSCRAKIEANSPATSDADYAIGVYHAIAQLAYTPDDKEIIPAKSFQLLKTTPATQQQTQQRMVDIAWAAYAEATINSSLAALKLGDSCQFFGAAPMLSDKNRFDLTPENVDPITVDDSSDYLNVAYTGQEASGDLVIGIRGTLSDFAGDVNNSGNIIGTTYYDWANNFIAAQTNITGLGDVHIGFYYATLSLMGEISGGNQGIYQWVDEKVKANDQLKITIAGHSKGGAMANIVALLLNNQYPDIDINVTTFGAPKAGGVNFAANYNQAISHSYSYIYSSDFVPWLPFDNEMVSLVNYSVHQPFSAGLSVLGAWIGAWADHAVLSSPKPQLKASSSSRESLNPYANAGISTLILSLCGNTLKIETPFDELNKVIKYVNRIVLTKAHLEEMATFLKETDITKISNLSGSDPAQGITNIFQFISKNTNAAGAINWNELGNSIEKNLDVVAWGLTALVISIADLAGVNWLTTIKNLDVYKNEIDSPNNYFPAFIDTVVEPLQNNIKALWDFGKGASTGTLDATEAVIYERYYRVGHTRFLYKNPKGGLITQQGITPALFIAQILKELSPGTWDSIGENNPVANHSAYKTLFST